jgi:hypothetical protein
MKKSVFITIFLGIWLSVSLHGQDIDNLMLEEKSGNKRNNLYNLEELKVRWKKASLENCPLVPCITFTCGTSAIADID